MRACVCVLTRSNKQQQQIDEHLKTNKTKQQKAHKYKNKQTEEEEAGGRKKQKKKVGFTCMPCVHTDRSGHDGINALGKELPQCLKPFQYCSDG